MEKLVIKNFGGISKAEIDINKINLIIGKEATGKSIVMKLIYYFKNTFRMFYDYTETNNDAREIEDYMKFKFNEYFPIDNHSNNKFEIIFKFDKENIITINNKKRQFITLSVKLNKLLDIALQMNQKEKYDNESEDEYDAYRPKKSTFKNYLDLIKKELNSDYGLSQIYVPAGRSFFAILNQSIFSFLSSNNSLNKFLINFGSIYENMKNSNYLLESWQENEQSKYIDSMITDILGGKFKRINSEDYLIHSDKRKIRIDNLSSGQQEVFPLLLAIKSLSTLKYLGEGVTLYIEEPEVHLFPSTQKKIIDLIFYSLINSNQKIELFIATHSPYIVTSVNNKLLDNNTLANINFGSNLDDSLSSSLINAYEFKDNTANNIIDDETGLIDSEYLDEISDILNEEFENNMSF